MAYAYPGEVSLDYYPCHYGASKLVFRGPRQSLKKPYCVALGGTETYGKFVAKPFPAILADLTDRTVINFGIMNAGLDVFLNDLDILDIASDATLTVVQIIGAHNLSNRFYSVHPRRNDRFLRASPWLQTVYREVDFTEFHFTRHMLQTLHQVSPGRFAEIAGELQKVWVERMRQLLRGIRGRTLLLWMADHKPTETGFHDSPCADPVLISAGMIEQVRSYADAYLEVVISRQATEEGVEAMSFADLERPAAEGVPGPMAHAEVADAIANAMKQLLGKGGPR